MCDCKLCGELKDNLNIVKKYNKCFVMFNKYPYLPIHLMVVPYEGKSFLHQYDKETRNELMEVVSETQQKILEICGSSNIGINSGEYSGGSIEKHLHIHIVGRDKNDMNFMHTTLDDKTKSLKYGNFYIDARKMILDKFNI